MTDRRSHRRFVLGECSGEIRLLHDVLLESMEPRLVSVIARAPCVEGEELTLHVVSRHGTATALTVRVLDCLPIPVDGALRHRVRLTIVRIATGSGPVQAMPPWSDDEVIGCVLVRRAEARILDVSVGGCFLETSAVLNVGTSALLDVAADGKQYFEMIRVCRAGVAAGASSRGRAGAEFLPTFEAASRSLRPLVAHLEIKHAGLVQSHADLGADSGTYGGRLLVWPRAD